MPAAVISISGTKFESGLHPKAAKQVRHAIADAETWANLELKSLAALAKTGDVLAAQEKSAELLSDARLRLAAAVGAARKRPILRRPKLEKLYEIATVDLEAKITEIVRVSVRKKGSGGYRPVCTFGMKGRTAQEAVKRVLAPYFVPKPFQFTMKGVPAAIEGVRQAIAGGFVHAARLDIKNFYASFNGDKLAHELPLPKGVVEYVVTGRHMNCVTAMQGDHPAISIPHIIGARQGLPQGSICSPIVAARALSRLPTLLVDTRLVNYADDFLLLAKDAATLDKGMAQIVADVKALPDGIFDLVAKSTGHMSTGMDFLGHRLQADGEQLRLNVSAASAEKFYHTLAALDIEMSHAYGVAGGIGDLGSSKAAITTEKAIALLCELREYARSWIAAFKLCEDIDDYAAPIEQSLAGHLEALQLGHKDLDHAIAQKGVRRHFYEYHIE